jgi:hypothetical protein
VRRAALALVAVVLLAACVESDPSTVDVGTSSTSTPTTVAGQPSTTTSRPTTRRTIIVGGTDAVPDAAAPAAAPRATQPSGGPGSLANELLGANGWTAIAIQVLTQDGAEPRQATLDRLVEVLESVSGKPVSTLGGTLPVERRWGPELAAQAQQQAPRLPEGTLLLQFAFVHGQSNEGPDVLGISLTSDVSAVFVDQVDGSATGLVSPGTIEKAVAVHELGHLLGLVDLYLHTGRADPAHPGHSTDERSVMYWAVESTLVGDLLTGGPPQDFDAQDLADLRRIAAGA